jgi:hypothetical protein
MRSFLFSGRNQNTARRVALQGRKERKVFMKKTLLIVAMLLLVATPVMATTTVKVLVNPAEQYTAADGNKVQPVSIAYVTDVNVRAFALDINVESDGNSPNFQGIRNFKTGESTVASPGYGIFPSRFRDFIVVTGPNWVDTNYNPTTAWNEPGTITPRTGIGFPKMIVEMGTLFAGDANKPAWSGTLFKFDVNAWGRTGIFHVTVAANTLRGGVVNGDGNSIVSPDLVLEGNEVSFPCTLPNVVNQAEATATAAITNAGFALGNRTTACSDTIAAGNIISTNPAAGVQTCGISVDYVVSTGSCGCIVPNVVDTPESTATANIIAAGFTLGARTTACHATIVAGNIISTNPAYTGTPITCGTAVAYVVSIGTVPGAPGAMTIPATDPDGAYAVSWGAATGATTYQLESSAAGSGTTIFPLWVQIYSGTALTFNDKVGGGVWSYRVKATNACGSGAYTTGGNTCTVAECLKTTATGYADWQKWRYPACWCFRRQCRGDTDGRKAGYWVSATPDLGNFKAAYGKTDVQLVAIACTWNATTGNICAICSDLNHAKAGYRVSATPDLATFKTYYGKADAIVTCCDTAAPAGDCTLVAGDPFNFWTN